MITEADLPSDWTRHYGAFMTFGDSIVMGTCRTCLGVVTSDYFAGHAEWHTSVGHKLTDAAQLD